MRLIDADKLKYAIHCAYSDDLEILEKIDEQPTAFDVDKVISELKRDKFVESECILFAIRNHKLLRPRIDAYQDFLPRTTVSGITMVGIRTAESVQRLQNIASMTKAGNKMTAKKQVFPIYDWTDNDVWLFLLRNHVDIPEIYLFLWQSGSSKRQMRVK